MDNQELQETPVCERIGWNKFYFGKVLENKSVSEVYLKKMEEVPDFLRLIIIDLSVEAEKYFKVVEDLVEDRKDIIILISSNPLSSLASVLGETRVLEILDRENILFLRTPIDFDVTKSAYEFMFSRYKKRLM